jgi:hypothetical protein
MDMKAVLRDAFELAILVDMVEDSPLDERSTLAMRDICLNNTGPCFFGALQ